MPRVLQIQTPEPRLRPAGAWSLAGVRAGVCGIALFWILFPGAASAGGSADVLELPQDIENPALSEGTPAPGVTVLQALPQYAGTRVAHTLHLPADWVPGRRFPVLVEYSGNSVPVRGNKGIGFALTESRGFLWVVLPFVGADRQKDEEWWWGDVSATLEYAKAAVSEICEKWGGDSGNVVLAGYSRGAIACNYIGLHDDEIARLWRAMVVVSHYDDAHIPWGMSPEERSRAPERIRRLGDTPQLICGEYCSRPQSGNDVELRKRVRTHSGFDAARAALGLEPLVEVEGTRAFVQRHCPTGQHTFLELPWVNHGSAVFLRNTPERTQIRAWLRSAVGGRP